MPYRLENCKSMVLPNPGKWKIQGHSKSGERTGFWIEQLKVVLDAGLSTYRSPKCIFLSHSHTDHSTSVEDIYTCRVKPVKGQESMIGRPLVMAEYCVPLIKKHMESIVDMARGTPDSCQIIEKRLNMDTSEHKGIVWQMQGTHPFVVHPGTVVEVPGLNDIVIEIVEGHHSVQTLGYGFNLFTSKLKDEYKSLKGKEIKELRKSGIEITEKLARPELIFYGDTNAKTLLEDTEWHKYPVIMIECTIFEDEDKVTKDRLEEHTAWFQIKHVPALHPETYFVFMHSSMAVDDKFLKEFEVEQKETLKTDNFTFWTDI